VIDEESLGSLIARRRQELGKSQDRLADLMCAVSGRATVTKNEVSRYEREERIPTSESLRLLAQALDMSVDTLEHAAAIARTHRRRAQAARVLEAANPIGSPATVNIAAAEREEDETERREVLRSIAAASLVVAGWPVGARPGVELPRRILPEHATELREATNLYRAWVSRHGGGRLRRGVAALLERASMMHSASTDEGMKCELLQIIADLAGLGAYIARDVEAHGDAREMYRLALQAAKATEDRHLGGHLIVRMAGHNIELRRPGDTLGLLGAARQAARSALSPAERANQLCIEAWANAQRRDTDAVRRAVGQAEEEFARQDGTEFESWGRQHVTEAELFSLTGAAYGDLARADRRHASTAIARLQRALTLRGAAHARNRTLDLVSLAEAFVIANELDEAGNAAFLALEQVDDVASGRLANRLTEVGRALSPHRNRSELVDAFLYQLPVRLSRPHSRGGLFS